RTTCCSIGGFRRCGTRQMNRLSIRQCVPLWRDRRGKFCAVARHERTAPLFIAHPSMPTTKFPRLAKDETLDDARGRIRGLSDRLLFAPYGAARDAVRGQLHAALQTARAGERQRYAVPLTSLGNK